jgi:hypothetical protein
VFSAGFDRPNGPVNTNLIKAKDVAGSYQESTARPIMKSATFISFANLGLLSGYEIALDLDN